MIKRSNKVAFYGIKDAEGNIELFVFDEETKEVTQPKQGTISLTVEGKEQITLAINEKGQLEKNGQAITDIVVNNKGELTDAKGTLEELPDEKSVQVSFNINNAIDSILSALGLNSKNETINNEERVRRILNAYGDNEDVIVLSNHINAGGGEGAGRGLRL